jgi:hypothetical protein
VLVRMIPAPVVPALWFAKKEGESFLIGHVGRLTFA